MKMLFKKLSLSVLALVPFVLAALWFMWEIGYFPDLGVESGYYGQFNRVKHAIEDMPDVRIVDQWQHKDVSLEDFGFTLQLPDGQTVRVDFWENSPQMKERDKETLRQFVRQKIESAQDPDGKTQKTQD